MRLRVWQVLALGAFALVAAAAAAFAEPAPSPWPELRSDIERDPTVISGTLDNGFRYVIRRNGEPKGRVSLRLIVAAGSLHERDDERGLAHFVEHLAFRGTRDFPGEALANMLQREGFAFGPDNTAFTLYDHTIYHLEMPRNDEETLRKALLVFREYSSNLTFDPVLIEKERGVILSEKAMRDTADYRNSQRHTEVLFPGSLPARRSPIGTEDVIRTCTRDTLVGFYDAWYRPERLALVAIGDVDPALVKAVASELFSSLTARAPARPEPAGLKPTEAAKPSTQVFKDSGNIGASIAFQRPFPVPEAIETHEKRIADCARSIAFNAFIRRMQRLARTSGDAFVAPTLFVQDSVPGWQNAWFSASARLDQWQNLLRTMEQEHRRALLFGFTPEEIDLARRQMLESLDAGVRTASTRDSRELAGRAVNAILYGFPLVSPETLRDELVDGIVALTPEACHRVFTETWAEGAVHVTLGGPDALNAGADDINAVLVKSREQTVQQPTPSPLPPFAYETFGKAGEIVAHQVIEDLDVHLAQFSNGVRLNFKATDFDHDSVGICIRLAGGGKLSLKKKQAGLDWFASWAFVPGGLGKHTPDELNDILVGRSLSGWFHVGNDCFMLTARCARRDLQMMMKVLCAHLVDPGYRPESIQHAKASFGSNLASLVASPGGPLRVSMAQLLFNDDPRFATPVQENYGPDDLRDLRKWLTPWFAKAPLEVAIVGDTRWEEVSGIVARTLGALGKRDTKPASAKVPSFAKPSGQPAYFQAHPTLNQAAIAVVFPTPSFTGVHTTRRAHLLARVLEERVRLSLREDLGSAYALDASFVEDSGLPGLNHLAIYAEVDMNRVGDVRRRLSEEFRNLLRDGIDPDDFARAKAPMVRNYHDEMRTNQYWLFTVLSEAQTDPEKIPAVRSRLADVESITLAELNELLRAGVQLNRAFEFVSVPAPR
ncbi:M16 family metallopeptidase [Nibricoccus sp. IMCC34717]|uniref:M16 family metallopeptidase n=1 Tax=Nibricoccus sp. IMCC34717 TaxID=3034021 RepID=UPI00384AA419